MTAIHHSKNSFFGARLNVAHRKLLGLAAIILMVLALPAQAEQLVFGSFRSEENANNWAARLALNFGIEIIVQRVERDTGTWYRVQTHELAADAALQAARRAQTAGVEYWRLLDGQPIPATVNPPANEPRLNPPARTNFEDLVEAQTPATSPDAGEVAAEEPQVDEVEAQTDGAQETVTYAEPVLTVPTRRGSSRDDLFEQWEWDVGIESRIFGSGGFQDSDQYSASVAIAPEYYVSWAGDRQAFTFAPFIRIDSADEDRTHADVRELFYSYVGGSWDVHVGARRVFWGVTEFHHLVDIINQTDAVENIDGEDKLGQPMVQLSLVQDWGLIDLYLLTGFRERTFPGMDGRFRQPLRVLDDDATYESSREDRRIDLAARWSHHVGPVELGVHHFAGTSREPMFNLGIQGAEPVLIPYYPVINQTGVDAQAILGDWALKLEGFHRSGFGDSYHAFNVGVERTLVGVLGSQADLGLVAEFMYDERGDAAFNTLFERDIALGGRFALNDFANTQALFGIIFDTERSEYAVSLEASRELTETWTLILEGRVFAGGETWERNNPLTLLADPDYKSAWLQQDDYLQIEFKKFF